MGGAPQRRDTITQRCTIGGYIRLRIPVPSPFYLMSFPYRLGVVTIAAWLAGAASAQEASFRGLGDLPGGLVQSLAIDVSNGGSVVVGSSSSSATPDGR